jgi:hypothetical protein
MTQRNLQAKDIFPVKTFSFTVSASHRYTYTEYDFPIQGEQQSWATKEDTTERDIELDRSNRVTCGVVPTWHPSCDIRPNLASTFTLPKPPLGNSSSRRPRKHQYRLSLVSLHTSATELRNLVSKCPPKGAPTPTNHSPRIQMRSDYSN